MWIAPYEMRCEQVDQIFSTLNGVECQCFGKGFFIGIYTYINIQSWLNPFRVYCYGLRSVHGFAPMAIHVELLRSSKRIFRFMIYKSYMINGFKNRVTPKQKKGAGQKTNTLIIFSTLWNTDLIKSCQLLVNVYTGWRDFRAVPAFHFLLLARRF